MVYNDIETRLRTFRLPPGSLTKQHAEVCIISGCSSQVVDLLGAVVLFFLPESQVLLQEFDDGLGIAEVILLELVNLVESLLKSGVGERASSGVVLEHFVVKDRVVESQAQLDWVAGGEVDGSSSLIELLGLVLNLLKDGILGILSNVAVIVTDHLDKEGLGIRSARLGQHLGLNHLNNASAVSSELVLNSGLVGAESSVELAVLGVLFDGTDGSAGGTFA